MARINESRIERVAAFLKANPPKSDGLDFYSFPSPQGRVVADWLYPPLNHTLAIDFFFLACLYQFGFWYGDDRGYVSRMQVPFDGKPRSGSETVWRLLRRQLDRDPAFFSSARLAAVTPQELSAVLALPDGLQWPDFETRFQLTRHYGRWLVSGEVTPKELIRSANRFTADPLSGLLSDLQHSPFGDDLLQKKQLLLAMALANRPEHFLKVPPNDLSWRPIIDYHVMRILLRLGLVELERREVRQNRERLWVSVSREESIRQATYSANQELIGKSGLTMPAIDELLWGAGRYCPDYKPPECDKCVFNDVCAKRTELFQPVFRTTAY